MSQNIEKNEERRGTGYGDISHKQIQTNSSKMAVVTQLISVDVLGPEGHWDN